MAISRFTFLTGSLFLILGQLLGQTPRHTREGGRVIGALSLFYSVFMRGADGRTRTDNLRFTKPLLCH